MRNKYLVLPIIVTLMSAMTTVNAAREEREDGVGRNGQRVSGKAINAESAIADLTSNITAEVLKGNDLPILERAELLYNTEKTLTDGINSLLLVGDARTGKTLFLKTLAERLSLKGKELLLLDTNALVAGTRWQGDLEEKIAFLKEGLVKNNEKYILVVENIETLIASKQTESFATELAVLAQDKQISMIGVTTPEKLSTVIQKEGAAIANLPNVEFAKPTREEVIRQLQLRSDYLEKYYKVEIEFNLLEKIVDLTQRFQSDKPLADQSYINLTEYLAQLSASASGDSLDSRATEAKIKNLNVEKNLIEKELSRGRTNEGETLHLQNRLVEIASELEALDLKEKNPELRFINQQIREADATLKDLKLQKPTLPQDIKRVGDEIKELQNARLPDLRAQKNQIIGNMAKSQGTPIATRKGFASYLAEKTALDPRMFGDDLGKYLNYVEAELNRQVIGQKEAISQIMKAIRIQYSGYSNKNGVPEMNPILLLGPTGIGKTEIARVLSKLLFGRDGLVKIDGGDLSLETSVNKLLGSNAGYVDSEKGGTLSEPVRRRGFVLVLYDEMARIIKPVRDALYPILEEGKGTDGLGRQVDYTNTVQLGAANVADQYAINKRFMSPQDFSNYVATEWNISQEEQKRLSPSEIDYRVGVEGLRRIGWEDPFINRHTVIMVNALSLEEIKHIANIMMQDQAKAVMAKSKARLVYDEKVIEALAKSGFDAQMGARPLKRAKRNTVTDLLVELLYNYNISTGDEVKLSVANAADNKSATLTGEVLRQGQTIGSSSITMNFLSQPVAKPSSKTQGMDQLLAKGNKMTKAKAEATAAAKERSNPESRTKAAVKRAVKKAR